MRQALSISALAKSAGVTAKTLRYCDKPDRPRPAFLRRVTDPAASPSRLRWPPLPPPCGSSSSTVTPGLDPKSSTLSGESGIFPPIPRTRINIQFSLVSGLRFHLA
jgi:hypothetical protein